MAIIAGILASLSAWSAGGADPDPTPQVVVEMSDGSRLFGRMTAEVLEFDTQVLGRLKFPLLRLNQIEIVPGQKHLLLSTRNGDQLQGTFAADQLRLKTLFGELLLAREQVTALRIIRPTDTNGLRHHWRGDGDARDAAGSVGGQAAAAVEYVSGRRGKAFSLTGEAEGVQFRLDPSAIGKGDFSVSFWFWSADTGGIEYAMSKREACAPVQHWEVRGERDGNIGFAVGDVQQGFTARHITSRTRVKDAAWHHLVFIRRDTTLEIFVDGRLDQTNLTPWRFDFSNNAPLRFGSGCCAGQAGQTHFKGLLDEVRLYDRALTASEAEGLFISEK